MRYMIKFGSDLPRSVTEQVPNGAPEVVAMPIRVDDHIVAHGRSPPGLAAVDEGSDVDHLVHGDDEPVGTTDAAVEVVGEVFDVVH